MRRLFLAVAVLMVACTGVAFAQDTDADAPKHRTGGLGFHNSNAPIGIRWWFSGQKVGIDLGFGFLSEQEATSPFGGAGYTDEKLMRFTIDAGVPFVFSSWNRVHALLRPGVNYISQEFTTSGGPPATFTTETATLLQIMGEIEAEVFLADNLSVSASHGIVFASFDPGFPGSDTASSFGTFGNNFTEVGFHMYLWGSGE
jgi:hypothetical protein